MVVGAVVRDRHMFRVVARDHSRRRVIMRLHAAGVHARRHATTDKSALYPRSDAHHVVAVGVEEVGGASVTVDVARTSKRK